MLQEERYVWSAKGENILNKIRHAREAMGSSTNGANNSETAHSHIGQMKKSISSVFAPHIMAPLIKRFIEVPLSKNNGLVVV